MKATTASTTAPRFSKGLLSTLRAAEFDRARRGLSFLASLSWRLPYCPAAGTLTTCSTEGEVVLVPDRRRPAKGLVEYAHPSQTAPQDELPAHRMKRVPDRPAPSSAPQGFPSRRNSRYRSPAFLLIAAKGKGRDLAVVVNCLRFDCGRALRRIAPVARVVVFMDAEDRSAYPASAARFLVFVFEATPLFSGLIRGIPVLHIKIGCPGI